MRMVDVKPLRFGIVGAGGMAHMHASALASQPDVGVVTAFCDPVPDLLERFAERAPRAHAFTSLDRMLDSGEIDAAIIATPPHLHAAQAIAIVRRGIPVIVEKPVTCTTAELRQLVEESDRAGAFVMPAQMRRFAPDMVAVRSRVEADPAFLGPIRSFGIQSLQGKFHRGGGHWALDGNIAGGGVTISLAIHQIDIVRFLTGEDYTRVSASAAYDAPFHNGAESSLSATLELEGGAVGTLQASYVATRSPFCESLNLLGTNGSVVQHARRVGDYIGPLMVSSTVDDIDDGGVDQWLGGWTEVLDEVPEDLLTRPFATEQAHFADVVRGAIAPALTLRSNFNTIACIEALMLSAREARAIEVEPW